MSSTTRKAGTYYVILIAGVAALGGFLFGYDTAVINGAVVALTKAFHASSWLTGLAVSLALLGSAVVEVINRSAAEFCASVESDTLLLIHNGDFLQQFPFTHLSGLEEIGGKCDVHEQIEMGVV